MAVDSFQPVDPTPTRHHKVWLIGGTSESAELAKALWVENIPYIVSVTTPAAKHLYPPQSPVTVGALTPEAMATFVIDHNIRCILDASHPFATEVSQQAIALSQNAPIPYLRYERDSIETKVTGTVTTVASLEALVNSDLLHHQRVLFTLGYRHLAQFAPLRPQAILFARVLPSAGAIAGAIAAGFAAHEIIALRPPVSLPLETALWQQWQISRVVAKASGQPSGEAIKRQAAEQLGIQLILIQRPPVIYPKQTHSIKEAIAFCTQTLRMY